MRDRLLGARCDWCQRRHRRECRMRVRYWLWSREQLWERRTGHGIDIARILTLLNIEADTTSPLDWAPPSCITRPTPEPVEDSEAG